MAETLNTGTSQANGRLWGARARDWAEIQEGQFAAAFHAVLAHAKVGVETNRFGNPERQQALTKISLRQTRRGSGSPPSPPGACGRSQALSNRWRSPAQFRSSAISRSRSDWIVGFSRLRRSCSIQRFRVENPIQNRTLPAYEAARRSKQCALLLRRIPRLVVWSYVFCFAARYAVKGAARKRDGSKPRPADAGQTMTWVAASSAAQKITAMAKGGRCGTRTANS